jgi:hypothetical protein
LTFVDANYFGFVDAVPTNFGLVGYRTHNRVLARIHRARTAPRSPRHPEQASLNEIKGTPPNRMMTATFVAGRPHKRCSCQFQSSGQAVDLEQVEQTAHRQPNWLRRHLTSVDNIALPTWVRRRPTFTRSTAGDGSGGIRSSRVRNIPSPRSTSHSAASLTRSRQEASSCTGIGSLSIQSDRPPFASARFASCLNSPGCCWRIASRLDICAGERYGKCFKRIRDDNVRPRLWGQISPPQRRSLRWRTKRGSLQLF